MNFVQSLNNNFDMLLIMEAQLNTVFDNIIVGDGPISRTLLFYLNASISQSVLIIDAGTRAHELREKIKIDSNIDYDSPLKAPSFHTGKDSHVWYGGCQGWQQQFWQWQWPKPPWRRKQRRWRRRRRWRHAVVAAREAGGDGTRDHGGVGGTATRL